MNFIEKIFMNKIDDSVHRHFQRFGKGTYDDRALVDISVSKKVKIKTSFEFANELVEYMVEKISGKVSVSGVIIYTKDISSELGFEVKHVKQYMGVRSMEIETKLDKEQMGEIMRRYPSALLLFSFDTDYGRLKIKPKSPKSAKPGKGDEEAKADFCVLTTGDKEILKYFAFDVNEKFNNLFIKHTFVIKEFEIPAEYGNDFSKIRTLAKRKGEIIRYLDIDGRKKELRKDFCV